jgi:hypothetical protein
VRHWLLLLVIGYAARVFAEEEGDPRGAMRQAAEEQIDGEPPRSPSETDPTAEAHAQRPQTVRQVQGANGAQHAHSAALRAAVHAAAVNAAQNADGRLVLPTPASSTANRGNAGNSAQNASERAATAAARGKAVHNTVHPPTRR